MSKPLIRFNDYPISVSVFENKKGYSISLQKAKKIKDTDNYEYDNIYLFDNDLLKVSELLKSAYNFCISQKEMTTEAEAEIEEPAKTEINEEIATIDDEIPF